MEWHGYNLQYPNITIKNESLISPIFDHLRIILLMRFASPFIKEVFEGIIFAIYNSQITSISKGYGYPKKGYD